MMKCIFNNHVPKLTSSNAGTRQYCKSREKLRVGWVKCKTGAPFSWYAVGTSLGVCL